MAETDWRTRQLRDGLLREPMLDPRDLAVWLPLSEDREFLHWERIGSVAGAKVEKKQGICTIPALSIRARQRRLGLIGKLLQRFRGEGRAVTWLLPTGDVVEQHGQRHTNLLLAWPESEETTLDESAIRAHWPYCERVEQLGTHLFVIRGVTLARPTATLAPTDGTPSEIAEQALATARQSGDRALELTALTDLGLLAMNAGEATRAVGLLDEALAVLQQMDDRSREGDVVGSLGSACLAAGHLERAAELFGREHELAQDPFALKLALEHLGLVHARQQDFPTAIKFLEEALALTRQVGDARQEITLLWHLGILYAELGQRESAVAHAEASVALMRRQGKPEVAWYSEHLSRYLAESANSLPQGGALVVGPGAPAAAADRPSFLRMAVTATKAMAQFVGSGGKRVSAEMRQARLRICSTCEHHTGFRCRLCGCFTQTKSWLPYEDCPARKWPRVEV